MAGQLKRDAAVIKKEDTPRFALQLRPTYANPANIWFYTVLKLYAYIHIVTNYVSEHIRAVLIVLSKHVKDCVLVPWLLVS